MKLPGISKLGKIKDLKKRKDETIVSDDVTISEAAPAEKKSRFGGFKLKRKTQETVSEAPQEQKSIFGKFKIKRKAQEAVSEEAPQEPKSRFGVLKRFNIKRNKGGAASVAQELVQEEQVVEAQEQAIEEVATEELVAEPQRKIGFSKKKIIIIAPIAAVAILLGLPASGILPENQYLPNVIGLVTGGSLGDITGQISNIGGAGSEQISELELTISDLETRVSDLEEQLAEVSQQSLIGPPGPQGFMGVQGTQGPPGPQGERGASTVPIMLTLGDRSTSVPNTIFIGQGFGALDYNAAKILIPVDGTMKNLFVTVSKAPNTDIDFMLVKNGFATDLTCTLSSSTDCSDKIHTISVKAGDTFAVKVSKDFPVNVPPFNIQVSMTLEQS